MEERERCYSFILSRTPQETLITSFKSVLVFPFKIGRCFSWNYHTTIFIMLNHIYLFMFAYLVSSIQITYTIFENHCNHTDSPSVVCKIGFNVLMYVLCCIFGTFHYTKIVIKSPIIRVITKEQNKLPWLWFEIISGAGFIIGYVHWEKHNGNQRKCSMINYMGDCVFLRIGYRESNLYV
jgi:hypothetical protein